MVIKVGQAVSPARIGAEAKVGRRNRLPHPGAPQTHFPAFSPPFEAAPRSTTLSCTVESPAKVIEKPWKADWAFITIRGPEAHADSQDWLPHKSAKINDGSRSVPQRPAGWAGHRCASRPGERPMHLSHPQEGLEGGFGFRLG